jgi:hypothetical protein
VGFTDQVSFAVSHLVTIGNYFPHLRMVDTGLHGGVTSNPFLHNGLRQIGHGLRIAKPYVRV